MRTPKTQGCLLFPSRTLRPLLAVACLTLSAQVVAAQCPDGTPPPCHGAVLQGGIARRVNPRLDAHSWIVVPFTNAMRAPDLAWLSDASVNLLSIDMGRWDGINVVPDKRVGDLLRELPPGRADGALTLGDAMNVARRAGAGMLVMGDFFRIGKGARIIARVFDVRSGKSIRSVEQQATDPDSLLNAFGPLARGVLSVPPPPDARTGDVGTKNIDAYQAYLDGKRAFRRLNLAEAVNDFRRAIGLDSAFALAHYELANALLWGDTDGNTPAAHTSVLTAQRLGTGLPPRERALINGLLANIENRYVESCDIYAGLVAHDTLDVDAQAGLGDCAFHNRQVIVTADTLPGRVAYGFNRSLRAWTRVLDLDPTYYPAFDHILLILRGVSWSGCRAPATAPPCELWHAPIRRRGDSLYIAPVAADRNSDAWYSAVDSSAIERPLATNLVLARGIAERWVAADPSNPRARTGLARVLMSLGEIAAADSQLRAVPMHATSADFEDMRARMEIAIKLGRAAEARAWFDSLTKAIPDRPPILVIRGSLEAPFGRTARLTRGLAGEGQRLGPAGAEYLKHVPFALMGIADTAMNAAELAWASATRADTSCTKQCREMRLLPTIVYALNAPRRAWPQFDSLPDDYRNAPAYAIARHDTAWLRREAVAHDSLARRNIGMYWTDNGWTAIAAQAFLALHDTTSALRSVRFFLDTAYLRTPVINAVWDNISASILWPRMMLLRADLAGATGHPEEARYWYGRFIDLWAEADPELAPVVTRAKASLAALPPPRR